MTWFRDALRDPEGYIIYECRLCGASTDQWQRACDQCGSGEIARYEL
ncbi:DNA repair protein RadA [Haloarcula marina]|nr:DNA repair protein RadA [Halomicroarcula marina]